MSSTFQNAVQRAQIDLSTNASRYTHIAVGNNRTMGLFGNFQGTYQTGNQHQYESSNRPLHQNLHSSCLDEGLRDHPEKNRQHRRQSKYACDYEFHDPFNSPIHSSTEPSPSVASSEPPHSSHVLLMSEDSFERAAAVVADVREASNWQRQESSPRHQHTDTTNRRMDVNFAQSLPQATPSNLNIRTWQDQLLSWPMLCSAKQSSLLSSALGNIPGLLEKVDGEQTGHYVPAAAAAAYAPSVLSLTSETQGDTGCSRTNHTAKGGFLQPIPHSSNRPPQTIAKRRSERPPSLNLPLKRNPSERRIGQRCKTTELKRTPIGKKSGWIGPISASDCRKAMPLPPTLGFYKKVRPQVAYHRWPLPKLPSYPSTQLAVPRKGFVDSSPCFRQT